MSQQYQFDANNMNLLNLLNVPGWSAEGSATTFGTHHLLDHLHNRDYNAPLHGLHLNLHAGGVLTPMPSAGGDQCGSKEGLPPHPENLVTERQRRQTFNDKFHHLRSLLPNPNKNDRASIVGDAIEYIKELTRTVKELSILVDKKRCQRPRPRPTGHHPEHGGQSLRKCKDTDIDVRIVDEDATVKVVQRRKTAPASLLLVRVCRALDELRLDLQHVSGGHVGDYYCFLFSTKISEGSSVYASGIADRLIEVVHPH